ncbi:ABC transporter permease [Kribbella aluminosa]
MTTEAHAAARRRPPLIAVIVLLTAVLTVFLIAFAWPSARSQPRDVPLAVAGPAPAVAQVRTALDQAVPGGFELAAVPDRQAAVQRIKDRDAYGAIVLDSPQPEVLTASAAGPAVAQILTQLAGRMHPDGGALVTDVVPLPKDDPRGAGLAAGALPLVLGGIIAAGALTQLVRSGSKRMIGAITFAVTGGLALAAVLQYWLGSFEGSYLGNAGVIALSIAAISLTLLGLEWLLGTAGLALGGAVMMLLGNPLSGMTSAPEMLPSGWGTLGQLLPPGAAGTALRSVSFFDGAGIGRPLVVLGCWLLAGLLFCGLGTLRGRRRAVPARHEARAVAA